MTAHRILQLNAFATGASAVAMLAARGSLYPLFGLSSPILLDLLAISFLVYAGALALTASRRPVSRTALIVFTAADGAWVVASALCLLLFWPDLTPIGRALVIAAAVVVDVFAMLQFRAAGRSPSVPQIA